MKYDSKSGPLTVCCVQDTEYKAAGAELVSAEQAFASDIVLKVRPPTVDAETKLFQPGSAYAAPSPMHEPGQSVLARSLQAIELESCRAHAGLNTLAALPCSCREHKPKKSALALRVLQIDSHVDLYRLVSYIQPARNEDLVKALQEKKMTALGESFGLVPTVP